MTISKETLIEKLDQIESAYNRWKSVEEELEGIMGGYVYEGNLGQAVDSMLQSMVDLFCLVSEIPDQLVWWWIIDAEFGKSGAGFNRESGQPLTYLKSNAEFIEWELSNEC